MKILVTGGAGFIGSHVADALSDAAHEVTVFDIKPSPYLRDDQQEVVGDLMDMEFMRRVVGDNQVVFHLAGIADIDECKVNPIETARINILGTVQLLEICKDMKVKRFIFASSAYVYSNSGSFYRSSKPACESFIENYADLYGGAAMDVFELEPYQGPLSKLPNCLLTSHMGSMSIDCRTQMEIEATEEAVRFLLEGQQQSAVPEQEYQLRRG